jgi:hypothetical protein
VAEKYGVWVEKNMYGKKYMGVQRSAFLVDEKGKIEKAWPKISPKDTPTEPARRPRRLNRSVAATSPGSTRPLTATGQHPSVDRDGVGPQVVEVDVLERRHVGALEHHRARRPASSASAHRAAQTHHWSPGSQSGEAVLRHRCAEIVAPLRAELEELLVTRQHTTCIPGSSPRFSQHPVR